MSNFKTYQLTKILESTKKTILEVGDYAKKMQSKSSISVHKDTNDFSTNIDLILEKKIIIKLQKITPHIPVFSEEENIIPDSKLYWVVDPIDGTKNYYAQLPLWSVNIALFHKEKNEILLGVVYFPAMKDLFWALINKPAYLNGAQITPSKKKLKDAIIHAELPNRKNIDKYSFKLEKLFKTCYKVRSWGIASSICYVANGTFDGYIDFSRTTKPFDIYAPILIARRAGCKIIDFDLYKTKNYITKVTNGFEF